MPILIAPSILSADFKNLESEIHQAEKGGAHWIHLDVMDGHFVPNITFGPMVVKTARAVTKLPLDTHLMIEKPERYLETFKNAGSDILTVHVETCPHLHRTVQHIKQLGMKAGVSLNPSTPAVALKEIIDYVDLILVMTVNPGFGGQQFISSMLDKIRELSAMIGKRKVYLEVDGGIDVRTAPLVVEAGANVLVAGNSVFGEGHIVKSIKQLRKAVQ